MEVPKLDKIVINMGVGEAKKMLNPGSSCKRSGNNSGQKAVLTRAKNSVANFKIREGMPIGCKVTLRGEKMYEFADRLINLLCLVYVTSVVLIQTHLTEEETMHWVLKNS